MSFLQPTLSGQRLTVEQAIQQPLRVNRRISELVAPKLVAPRFFANPSKRLEGGALLYQVVTAEDLLSGPISHRAPYSEYPVVSNPEPKFALAPTIDQGGKFSLSREEVRRDAVDAINTRTTQLANRIARAIDETAIAAVEAAIADNPDAVVPGNDWSALVTLGPETELTPSHERPEADFANAQLAADRDDMGVTLDTIITNPVQAAHLRTAYGSGLSQLLGSFGLELVTSNLVPSGTAYVVQAGAVGISAVEEPLQTKTWFDDRDQVHWVQSFVSMAFAVNGPLSVKKLTGLAGV
ncbi:hypothetical protein RBB84_02550 [Rhodococcus sp. D-6]|uniref:Major capsid protein n=1 Tax=Rhodococcus sp. D-6 TaxID=1387842 RepID=A0AAU7UXH9_9NOCA|nr:major capsid protein [Rhodococcus sp. HS-D2]